jgi:hypothetical protein
MNSEERLANLERELGHVKRHNRQLVNAGLAIAGVAALSTIVLAVFLILHVVGNEVVDAKGFSLHDADGKVRAVLSVDKNGPALVLLDENGKFRAILRVIKDEAALCLYDKNGIRAVLGAVEDGAGLQLSDVNGKPRASFGAGYTTMPDGRKITYPESSIRLSNPEAQTIWAAP